MAIPPISGISPKSSHIQKEETENPKPLPKLSEHPEIPPSGTFPQIVKPEIQEALETIFVPPLAKIVVSYLISGNFYDKAAWEKLYSRSKVDIGEEPTITKEELMRIWHSEDPESEVFLDDLETQSPKRLQICQTYLGAFVFPSTIRIGERSFAPFSVKVLIGLNKGKENLPSFHFEESGDRGQTAALKKNEQLQSRMSSVWVFPRDPRRGLIKEHSPFGEQRSVIEAFKRHAPDFNYEVPDLLMLATTISFYFKNWIPGLVGEEALAFVKDKNKKADYPYGSRCIGIHGEALEIEGRNKGKQYTIRNATLANKLASNRIDIMFTIPIPPRVLPPLYTNFRGIEAPQPLMGTQQAERSISSTSLAYRARSLSSSALPPDTTQRASPTSQSPTSPSSGLSQSGRFSFSRLIRSSSNEKQKTSLSPIRTGSDSPSSSQHTGPSSPSSFFFRSSSLRTPKTPKSTTPALPSPILIPSSSPSQKITPTVNSPVFFPSSSSSQALSLSPGTSGSSSFPTIPEERVGEEEGLPTSLSSPALPVSRSGIFRKAYSSARALISKVSSPRRGSSSHGVPFSPSSTASSTTSSFGSSSSSNSKV